jgi:hypothetical protein
MAHHLPHLLRALHSPQETNLVEWAIASHGKCTRPFRKIASVDVNCHISC